MSKKITKKRKKKEDDFYVSDTGDTLTIKSLLSGIAPNMLPENPYVKNTVLSLVFFVLFLFFILSPFNLGGTIGSTTYTWFHGLFGYGYYVLPFLFVVQSYFYSIHKENTAYTKTKIFFAGLLLTSILGILDMSIIGSGGVFGQFISKPLLHMFDKTLGYIVLTAVFLISLIVLFEYSFGLKPKDVGDEELVVEEDDQSVLKPKKAKIIMSQDTEEVAVKDKVIETIKDKEIIKDTKKPLEIKTSEDTLVPDEMLSVSRKSLLLGKPYVPPPLSLLEKDKGKPEVGDIKLKANIIKRTLQNFGVQVEMDEISVGPSVTRYALKPAEGVKLSKILGLQNNLSLALAAHPIRIEAPIPGKSLVGIEVPNTIKTMVGLGTLLASDAYQKASEPLLIALGKGVSGKMYYENLAKMPHTLIAGTTGSGKSVMIHNLITSLLYKNSPENLRFIFIDPKRVELTLYNKIPHLLTPVITDPKKAILSLKWAGKEMTRRYDLLEKHQVRDIDSYHKNILMPALEDAKKVTAKKPEEADNLEQTLPETMPYIVIVIDELADIMQTYPKELESAIVRLAQMSRAVGIHLVLSTQRPSVNVITGTIKANIPSRLALQVASQIDSRTILDDRGAEELLGKGDMLFKTGAMSSPIRVQSPNITEGETKQIVKHLINTMEYIPDTIQLGTQDQEQAGTHAIFSSSFDGDGADEDVDDDLYDEAKQAVIDAKKASTSYLQRKFRIGYSRAARLMDILEQKGVVGPADGARPREVLIGKEQGSSDSDIIQGDQSDLLEEDADALLQAEEDREPTDRVV